MEITPRSRTSRNLSNFHLDPNNYRFVDHDNYESVARIKSLTTGFKKESCILLKAKTEKALKTYSTALKAMDFLTLM